MTARRDTAQLLKACQQLAHDDEAAVGGGVEVGPPPQGDESTLCSVDDVLSVGIAVEPLQPVGLAVESLVVGAHDGIEVVVAQAELLVAQLNLHTVLHLLHAEGVGIEVLGKIIAGADDEQQADHHQHVVALPHSLAAVHAGFECRNARGYHHLVFLVVGHVLRIFRIS